MEEPLKAKTVVEKTNLAGAPELDPSGGVEQDPRHHGEKRKREGLVSGEREAEEFILVGDTKAIKKIGFFDGGEQSQSQRSLFSKRQAFEGQRNTNLKGSLVKQESGGEEPVRAKQESTFNDFEKLREVGNFAVGQTWALYDDKVDGMPRLYAQITKVSAPGFCLSVTWLDPDPDDKEELQSYEKDLPVAVGWFKLGKSEDIKDHTRFSHLVHCNGEGSRFSVYPREGETWAIFKGRRKRDSWSYRDIDWSADPGSHRKYNYQFVEIVSEKDADTSADAPVGFLHKAKGFSSVFCRFAEEVVKSYVHNGYEEQFSHRVPSFTTTGTEAEGVPRRGAYELDPAALPVNIKEIDVPSHLLEEPTMSDSEETDKTHSQCVHFASKGVTFQTGQVWSFCSGEDNFPRYFGKVQKITFVQAFEQDPVVKLHIGRLKARPIKGVTQWIDKEMPIGCGSFRARKVLEIFTDLDVFSRLVNQGSSSGDGDDYSIMPKTGDVWAIYRNWSNGIEVADLQSQSYDLVEVLDDKMDYKVLLLAPDGGFNSGDSTGFGSVYVAATEHWMDGADVRFIIPKSELLRFSHRVPTSKVTKEMHGVLQEVYEPNI